MTSLHANEILTSSTGSSLCKRENPGNKIDEIPPQKSGVTGPYYATVNVYSHLPPPPSPWWERISDMILPPPTKRLVYYNFHGTIRPFYLRNYTCLDTVLRPSIRSRGERKCSTVITRTKQEPSSCFVFLFFLISLLNTDKFLHVFMTLRL